MHTSSHKTAPRSRAGSVPLAQLAEKARTVSELPDDARLTPDTAAEFLSTLGVPVKATTLRRWRCVRPDGPSYIKVGNRIVYEARALRRFAGA